MVVTGLVSLGISWFADFDTALALSMTAVGPYMRQRASYKKYMRCEIDRDIIARLPEKGSHFQGGFLHRSVRQNHGHTKQENIVRTEADFYL